MATWFTACVHYSDPIKPLPLHHHYHHYHQSINTISAPQPLFASPAFFPVAYPEGSPVALELPPPHMVNRGCLKSSFHNKTGENNNNNRTVHKRKRNKKYDVSAVPV